jgi:Transposase DDE domain
VGERPVAARAIRQTGQRRLTIDVDGSVVSTGLQVAWAQRGFNPHHRKVPSYYPITAYEAQSGQVLRVQNRPGNVHDGKAGVPFLRALLHQLRATLGRGYPFEFRMDGAFFRRDVLALLARAGAEYAIKVPFYPVSLRGKRRFIAPICLLRSRRKRGERGPS